MSVTLTPEDAQKMQQAFTAFKQANDAAQLEIKQFGRENGLLKERVERLSAALDEIELRSNRKSAFAGDEPTRVGGISKTQAKAFFFGEVLRGKADFAAIQTKGLSLGSDPAGGYLAPSEYVAEMIANIVEFSPIRAVARVRQTTRNAVLIPKRTSSAGAAWVEELGTRSETTNPAFGMVEMRSHELYAVTKVSKQELEDSVFDLEAFLRAEFAEQFGVSEGLGFVSGTGVGQPEGLLTNASVESVVSGSASTITADGLISLFYEPKTAYAQRGYFLLNRNTIREARKLKDGTGSYLWSAAGIGASSLVPGQPATILGRPYVECVDMPDIGANTYPIIFGSFIDAYTILDRVNMEVLVDQISSKSTGMVEFSARKRVGGGVVKAEAIKKLKIST